MGVCKVSGGPDLDMGNAHLSYKIMSPLGMGGQI